MEIDILALAYDEMPTARPIWEGYSLPSRATLQHRDNVNSCESTGALDTNSSDTFKAINRIRMTFPCTANLVS